MVDKVTGRFNGQSKPTVSVGPFAGWKFASPLQKPEVLTMPGHYEMGEVDGIGCAVVCKQMPHEALEGTEGLPKGADLEDWPTHNGHCLDPHEEKRKPILIWNSWYLKEEYRFTYAFVD
ncbi:hypothetical protein GH733_006615 [Mirounga leonina]|nr:hypothetical protein GH733_006615 [Mirounga leonina]